MRICLISREFPPDTGWGGIATFVHDLALGLQETGHEVEVIALSADNQDKTVEYEGIRVHRVAWTGLLMNQQSLLTAMPYSHNILKQISALWNRFLEIHSQKNFEVVEAPEMFAEGLFVAASKVAPLVVRLYTPHFKFIDERLHNITAALDHQFIALLERFTMLCADVVTSPSEDLKNYVCQDMNYPLSSMPIVRDPVNTNKFCPEGPKALSPDARLTVLFAGRLEARKGIYHLIEAVPQVVKAFPSVRFVIIGRDTNTAPGNKSVLSQLQQLLGQSGCSNNVQFIPGVPNSEMPAYFRCADLCVVPSLYDNAPFTCIEALSSGKPVIGTSAGGMKEYIVHEQSGLIIPPGNTDALVKALLELLQDKDKRTRFGEFARQHVLAHFDRKEIARQSISLYKQACQNFETSHNHQLYRHSPGSLLPTANDLLLAYDKMLYDLLYAHSWRFRLSHWFHMIKDRPRLTLAKAIVYLNKLASRLIGNGSFLFDTSRLEEIIRVNQKTI